MEYDALIIVGILFTIGTYLILTAYFTEMIFGFAILSNAVNLIILLTSGNPTARKVPIIEHHNIAEIVDPVPQALILTAIVIGFGLLSYLVVLAFRLYAKYGEETIQFDKDYPE